jgi:hypothetical protein
MLCVFYEVRENIICNFDIRQSFLSRAVSVRQTHRQAAGSEDVGHSGEKKVLGECEQKTKMIKSGAVCTVLYILWVIPVHGNRELRRGRDLIPNMTYGL